MSIQLKRTLINLKISFTNNFDLSENILVRFFKNIHSILLTVHRYILLYVINRGIYTLHYTL